ncbi:MAG TPA: hypothetical protein VMT59_07775 [Gaiellaceae bacterium]|nr:hypothetical protein [Gaiellaceae bacterium]
MKPSRRILIAGAVALAAVAGAGVAVAASHAWGSDQRQAVINDAAGRLGVTPSALQNAFKGALKDQIEAAVTAGKLTRAQADAIEARIDAGQGLGFGGMGGPGGPGGPGGMHHLLGPSIDAATTYLGLTEAQIRTQLQSGKTLAQIATAQGKTAEGLVDALVTAETAQLATAVKDGKLTAAQEQQILSSLKQRVTDMVNGTFGPGPGMHGGFGGGPHNGFRQGYFRQSAERSTPKTAL